MLQAVRAWRSWVSAQVLWFLSQELAQATKLPSPAFFLCNIRMFWVIHQKFIQFFLWNICQVRWKYKALSPCRTDKPTKTSLSNRKQYSLAINPSEWHWPGFKSQFYNILVVMRWTIYSSSLDFSFLNYKAGLLFILSELQEDLFKSA